MSPVSILIAQSIYTIICYRSVSEESTFLWNTQLYIMCRKQNIFLLVCNSHVTLLSTNDNWQIINITKVEFEIVVLLKSKHNKSPIEEIDPTTDSCRPEAALTDLCSIVQYSCICLRIKADNLPWRRLRQAGINS